MKIVKVFLAICLVAAAPAAVLGVFVGAAEVYFFMLDYLQADRPGEFFYATLAALLCATGFVYAVVVASFIISDCVKSAKRSTTRGVH